LTWNDRKELHSATSIKHSWKSLAQKVPISNLLFLICKRVWNILKILPTSLRPFQVNMINSQFFKPYIENKARNLKWTIFGIRPDILDTISSASLVMFSVNSCGFLLTIKCNKKYTNLYNGKIIVVHFVISTAKPIHAISTAKPWQ
jgi:hypothetical protein